MFKKIKNLALTSVLVFSMVPMVMAFGADNYRETIVLGGSASYDSNDYTTPAEKQYSSQSILVICEDARYSSEAYSRKTCNLWVQRDMNNTGNYVTDTTVSQPWTFGEGFDQRLANSVSAGTRVRLRFNMLPIAHKTYFDILRYYY